MQLDLTQVDLYSPETVGDGKDAMLYSNKDIFEESFILSILGIYLATGALVFPVIGYFMYKYALKINFTKEANQDLHNH